MKLPIKTRILEYAIENDKPFTAEEISGVMKKEYEGEKTSCTANMFGERDELVVTYRVTEFGKKYEKYIPGH